MRQSAALFFVMLAAVARAIQHTADAPSLSTLFLG